MKSEQRPTEHHEELRIEGLRALARVIVRHALANSDQEPEGRKTKAGSPVGESPEPGRKGGAP